jgi:hypothetical protein
MPLSAAGVMEPEQAAQMGRRARIKIRDFMVALLAD